jgi:hypothetical protein
VGPRAVLDVVVKRKIPSPRRESNPRTPIVQTVTLGCHVQISQARSQRVSVNYLNEVKSRDSSVSIVLGYGLDDQGSRVRFPAGARNFSLHHCVHNGSGAHTASYPMGTNGSFPGGKMAGA